MNQIESQQIERGKNEERPERQFFPVLLLLFVGSGCSALVYEIVWFQFLQFVIGSSAVSLGVLLGTFMGGMCLGSVGLPWIVSARRHPLRVYALVELGIGLIGAGMLFVLPAVGHLYTANIGHGMPGVFLRGTISAICLLPPTVLMGATLPAIARWMESTPQGISRLGFFYGANIAGAVFGCLLAGFYLLRFYDTVVATGVAVGINVSVSVIGLVLASRTTYRCPSRAGGEQVRGIPGYTGRTWPVYAAICLSGMTALAAEVVWTRQLSLLIGATVYTFSLILAVFLVGLGVGSSVGSLIARRTQRPGRPLAACQLLLAAGIAWTAAMLSNSLPYWPIDPSIASTPWLSFQLDIVRCLWALLPATCLWGASFPLALAAAASRRQDPARLVGGVYAANTVGAIAGALGASLFLIRTIGTQHAQQLLIGLSGAAAILALVSVPGLRGERSSTARPWRSRGFAVLSTLFVSAAITAVLAWSVPDIPRGLIAYGRYLPTRNDTPSYIYVGQGMNASIAVSELSDGVRNFHVSGKVVASSEPADMRLQRMLGHVPALVHPNPRSVLVVGCGAGVTAGSFVVHPGIERIVICEIEPLVPDAAGVFFDHENNGVVFDPRTEIVYDDARHFIVTTNETFDIITSDPIHPWVKGAAALYSREYFELCKQRLNPGGVITQWVPLYETNLEAVKSEVATFMDAFPGGTIWSNDVEGKGYDIVLLGQVGATRIDVDQLQHRLESPEYLRVQESLTEVELPSAISLLSTYAGQGPDLTDWLRGAEINRDRNLRLQYLAGLGLNSYVADDIYQTILENRKYPDKLFVASAMRERALRRMLRPLDEEERGNGGR